MMTSMSTCFTAEGLNYLILSHKLSWAIVEVKIDICYRTLMPNYIEQKDKKCLGKIVLEDIFI